VYLLKNKYMKKIKYLPSIKLRHLDIVAQEVPEYSTIMKEELGYSNNWLFTCK
jgi:hypothetical protein